VHCGECQLGIGYEWVLNSSTLVCVTVFPQPLRTVCQLLTDAATAVSVNLLLQWCFDTIDIIELCSQPGLKDRLASLGPTECRLEAIIVPGVALRRSQLQNREVSGIGRRLMQPLCLSGNGWVWLRSLVYPVLQIPAQLTAKSVWQM
jgi:hypothetical protein